MLLPVLSFKKDDDHCLDCRFISVSLFSIFEDILSSVFLEVVVFSTILEEISFLNVKVNNEKPSVINSAAAINAVYPVNRGPLSKNYHMIDYGFQKVLGSPTNWALFEVNSQEKK